MTLMTGGDTIQELTVEELRNKVGTGMQIDDPEEHMLLSMGPQHPSTHGVLRLLVELDGETVINLAPDIGFLHTGIEKTMESKTYTKALVMTDRMDYLSPMSNNLGYVLAVEKLLGVEVTPRRPGDPGDFDRTLPYCQPSGLVRNSRVRSGSDDRLHLLFPGTRIYPRSV